MSAYRGETVRVESSKQFTVLLSDIVPKVWGSFKIRLGGVP